MTPERLNFISEDPLSFLKQGLKLKTKIEIKQERIAFWRSKVESINIKLKPNKVSSTKPVSNTLETSVCSIVDLENDILADIQELVRVEQEIKWAIDKLLINPNHKLIFEMRYLNGLTLEEIAYKLKYALRWIQRLNKRALNEMKVAAKSRVTLMA